MAIGALFLLAALLAGSNYEAMQSTIERDRASGAEELTYEIIDRSGALKIAALSALRGERGYMLTQDTTLP